MKYIAALSLSLVAAVALAAVLVSGGAPQGNAAYDAEAQAFLTVINNYRQANGAGPLAIDLKFNDAAIWMSDDMAAYDYVAHTDSLGRSMTQRLQAFANPFPYTAWADNVAAGFETA